MMKRLTLLTTLLALTIAPVTALADADWPGWMTVHVHGLTTHETARVAVQYTTSNGSIKYLQYHASAGSPARFPIGSKARDLHITASVDGTNKTKTLRYQNAPSDVNVFF